MDLQMAASAGVVPDFLRDADPATIAISSADGAAIQPLAITPVRHNLDRHPLLQLPRLRQLAESLAGTDHIKLSMPKRKEGSAFYTLSEQEAKTTVHEVFDQIESPGSWIAIYYAEADSQYRALLDQTLRQLAPQIEANDPGMYGFNMFIFIAAPPTVTPFHIDRENNLNLQIAGRKRWRIWRPEDSVAVPREAVEEYFVRDSLRKLRYTPDLDARALHVEVGPGEGIHFPATCAHTVTTETDWVQPGNAVAVSVAMTYFTQDTRRRANVTVANDFLRHHLPGGAVGEGAVLDHLKYPLARALIGSRQLLRRTAPPRGT